MYILRFGTPQTSSSKLLLLDRDGTINEDAGYTYKLEDLSIMFDISVLARICLEHDIAIAVISNQSGVARGYFSTSEVSEFSNAIWGMFSQAGLGGMSFYYCLHLPEHFCNCRKPLPDLILKSIDDHNMEKDKVAFFGNSQSDLAAGTLAGVYSELVKERDLLIKVQNWITRIVSF